MYATQNDTLEEIEYPPLPSNGPYRLAVRSLREGMFVTGLDRPWVDTPFPGSGFILRSQAELQALSQHCRWVLVDPDLSEAELLGAIRAAAVLVDQDDASDQPWHRVERPRAAGPAAAGAARAAAAEPSRHGPVRRSPTGEPAGTGGSLSMAAIATGTTAVRPRADVHIQASTRNRFRQRMVDLATQGAADRARRSRWLGRLLGASRERARPELHDALHPFAALPAEMRALIHATAYPAPAPMRAVLPPARLALRHAEAAMATVADSVRAGGVVAFDGLAAAAAALADVAVANPAAPLWLQRVREQQVAGAVPAIGVALLLLAFGRQLGLPRASLDELACIGLLADIGKLRVPRELLDKPGLLDPAEFALVRAHVAHALEILSRSPGVPAQVLRGIAEHHERLDGSGYPKGLQGPSIGLYGRMAAIADVFAALTAARPYANPLSPEDALAGLHGWSESLFCIHLVEQFVQAIGVFPVGTLVELQSGEIAVVVEPAAAGHLQPRVLVLTARDKGPLRTLHERDGDRDPDEVYDGAPVRIARGLPTAAYGLSIRDYYATPIGGG